MCLLIHSSTQDSLDALPKPVFLFSLIWTASSLCTHHCRVNQNMVKGGWSGDLPQKCALDPRQNTNGDVPIGWLSERAPGWLSQGWETEPALPHTLLAPSPHITFLPGAKPPPRKCTSTQLHFCKELCTSRWTQVFFSDCSHAFSQHLAREFHLLLVIFPMWEMTGVWS